MKASWLPSRRSLLETILAVVAGFCALLAIVWPDWLESFGVHWDYGNGALEWLIPAVMALTAFILGIRAGRRWQIDFARAVRARG
ncbi:MAG TPA: hypothetical protein VHY09_04020 [Candidatus Methylacidiphilales bacterium]|jgi:hypothetical protein|nr:hypothetical protein [Candidatus Methylacidiphilales bacterium]